MFQTVRHWWTVGRGKVSLRLFLFEFVVVLLGVLAAQMLQDWFAGRAEARRAEEAVALLDSEATNFANIATYRLRARECEVARLETLAQKAAAGGTATDEERAAPIMPMPVISEWSDATRAAVSRHYPDDALRRYDSLRMLAGMIGDRQRQLENQWADFRLMTPGRSSAVHRAALELAVARSQGLLSAIDMNAAYLPALSPGFKVDDSVMKALAQMDHPCAPAALIPVSAPN